MSVCFQMMALSNFSIYPFLIAFFFHIISCTGLQYKIRPLVKSAYQKINFLFSQPKHMFWVLKRTVSLTHVVGTQKNRILCDSKEPSQ